MKEKELRHEKWIDLLSNYHEAKESLMNLTRQKHYIESEFLLEDFIEKIFLQDFYCDIKKISYLDEVLRIDWFEKPEYYAFIVINQYKRGVVRHFLNGVEI